MTNPRISVLVLAVRKKLLRAPMQALLSRLRACAALLVLELDEAGMACPVESWPAARVLVPLVSGSFPLERAARYAALRQPFVVNDLRLCAVLRDRRAVLRMLRAAAVPTPESVILDRDAGDVAVQRDDELRVYRRDGSLRGCMRKPFVEKPADAEDHNVHIYYKGGGVRRLFRKVKNRSSEMFPGVRNIRRDGSFVYEKFYAPRMCADVKVYAAGDYFYAEARKAPHVDGIVERDEGGLEVRHTVRLSEGEVAICNRVMETFGQFLNGFDLLRTKSGKTFVIDVNGWSFVKRETEFGPTCAQKLISLLLVQMTACPRPRLHTSMPSDGSYALPVSTRREIEN